jgi:tetratricopeptide (TPR) repeat protein
VTDAYRQFSALMAGGRHREAADFAEAELRRAGGADAFWLTQKANALNHASDHAGALEAARAALSAEPSNPYAILSAADALKGLHRYEEALGHYRELTGHEKLGSRARTGVFDCLSRLDRWEELLQSLPAAPQGERSPWRVKALAALGRNTEALEECRQWLSAHPDHPPALWELSNLEVALEGLDVVRARYERLAKIPTLPSVYREIYASLCRRAGLPELALKEYGRIDAAGSSARLKRKEAFLLAKTGREREAIPLMEELLSLDPKDIYLHSSYAAACGRTGELQRAIEFYIRLMGMFPDEKGLYGRINRLKKKLEQQAARQRSEEGPA